MTIVMALLLLFVLGILLLLYVLTCGLCEPDVQKARIGRSQPGVGLWSPHLFVLNFFKSGLTLNPHNKRHSFGLFISLYLHCVFDCIKEGTSMNAGNSQVIKFSATLFYFWELASKDN